jgi:23S rRNA (pseudouridine1915-N3)-methyltransferase
MSITILSIGKPPSKELQSLIRSYEKRLRSLRVEWQYIKPSPHDPKTAQVDEAEVLQKHIQQNDHVILLDEHGADYSSEALSKLVFSKPSLTFIIGGPYGVSQQIKERADAVVSLSSLVFPHQLVRLMLIEQLYRAEMIHTGHPYHHA